MPWDAKSSAAGKEYFGTVDLQDLNGFTNLYIHQATNQCTNEDTYLSRTYYTFQGIREMNL